MTTTEQEQQQQYRKVNITKNEIASQHNNNINKITNEIASQQQHYRNDNNKTRTVQNDGFRFWV